MVAIILINGFDFNNVFNYLFPIYYPTSYISYFLISYSSDYYSLLYVIIFSRVKMLLSLSGSIIFIVYC